MNSIEKPDKENTIIFCTVCGKNEADKYTSSIVWLMFLSCFRDKGLSSWDQTDHSQETVAQGLACKVSAWNLMRVLNKMAKAHSLQTFLCGLYRVLIDGMGLLIFLHWIWMITFFHWSSEGSIVTISMAMLGVVLSPCDDMLACILHFWQTASVAFAVLAVVTYAVAPYSINTVWYTCPKHCC